MSLTYMDWIERYNLNFQLHINETEENPVFKQVDLKEKIDDLTKYNKVIVDVMSTRRINKKYYYKIKYEGNLIGWCCPSEKSVIYLKTKKQEVKLLEEENIENDLSELIGIDTTKFKENSDKIFFSDFYALFNNNVYCAVILKDELLGFVPIDDISFFTHCRDDFKFTENEVNLYKNSKLEKLVIENFNHSNNTYTALGWFEDFEGMRVIIDGKRYWIDMKNTDIKAENKKVENTFETVIDTLLYQLNDKLEKQAEFYQSKIKRLEQDLEERKEKEKQISQRVKSIKELF